MTSQTLFTSMVVWKSSSWRLVTLQPSSFPDYCTKSSSRRPVTPAWLWVLLCQAAENSLLVLKLLKLMLLRQRSLGRARCTKITLVHNHWGLAMVIAVAKDEDTLSKSRLTVAAIHTLGLFHPICQLLVWTCHCFGPREAFKSPSSSLLQQILLPLCMNRFWCKFITIRTKFFLSIMLKANNAWRKL